jgi:hypothetical protein
MTKITTFLLFSSILLFATNLSAQTKTPYQKKSEALSLQLFRDLGVNPTTIKKYTDAGDIGALFFLGNISQKLQTERGMLALFRYQQGIKNAESLKNTVDFKRDADKKALAERKKENELEKQQEQKKQNDLAEKEEQRKRNYQNSDFVEVGNEIKAHFEKWAQKGEFEKTSEYENRIINESSNQFNNICFKELNERIGPNFTEKENSYSSDCQWLDIKLKNYDADKELYYISIAEGYGNDDDELIGTLKLSSAEAQIFKNTFSNCEKVVDLKDWTLYNYNLRPSKIIFLSKNENSEVAKTTRYTVQFAIKDERPLIYSANELKINILNLPQISFNYVTQAPIIIEKIKQKKLEEELAEHKKLEEDKKSNQEKRFNSLLMDAENIMYANKFKDKKPKEISKVDLIEFSLYNSKKIELYNEALKIKEDNEVRNKLVQCNEFEKEIEERKQKIERTNRILNELLRVN